MNAAIRIDLLTLFPGMARGFLAESMIGRAAERGLLDIRIHNIRDWADGPHRTTDDRPFGGGPGMLLKPEPLYQAWQAVHTPEALTIYLAPDGERLTSPVARSLATEKHLILISGHYEGIDERIRELCVDREISIGDYVLTNGTLPAAVLIDCLGRYVPGVLGESQSLEQDSFAFDGSLAFPQYTRPAEFRGRRVPEVLLSGNHRAIEEWRRQQRQHRTAIRRPGLTGSRP